MLSSPHNNLEFLESIKYKNPYPNPKNYVAYKINTPLNINGDLDKEEWSKAEWTDFFVDIQGSPPLPKPRYGTRAKMLYDETYFYVGAYLEDAHLIATITEKNAVIFQDNDFEIFIDPSSSSHHYTEFEMNAFNTIWALLIINPYRDNYNVINPYPITGLKTAVKLFGKINDPSSTDEGWSVEIAFPWNILRQFSDVITPPTSGEQWRVNFSRVEWKYDIVDGKYVKKSGIPEDNWVWSPQWEINMHKPEVYGMVQFSDLPFGDDSFKFNKDKWDIQMVLFWIYNTQIEYKNKSGAYAINYSQLLINESSFEESQISDQIKLNKIDVDDIYGYVASLIYKDKDIIYICNVRSDSRQWKEILKKN